MTLGPIDKIELVPYPASTVTHPYSGPHSMPDLDKPCNREGDHEHTITRPAGWNVHVRHATPLTRPDGTVVSYEYHRRTLDPSAEPAKDEHPLVKRIAEAARA